MLTVWPYHIFYALLYVCDVSAEFSMNSSCASSWEGYVH